MGTYDVRHKATTLWPGLPQQVHSQNWAHLESPPPQQIWISVTWCHHTLARLELARSSALWSPWEAKHKQHIQNMPHCDSTSSAAAVVEVLLEDKALLTQFHGGTQAWTTEDTGLQKHHCLAEGGSSKYADSPEYYYPVFMNCTGVWQNTSALYLQFLRSVRSAKSHVLNI